MLIMSKNKLLRKESKTAYIMYVKLNVGELLL